MTTTTMWRSGGMAACREAAAGPDAEAGPDAAPGREVAAGPAAAAEPCGPGDPAGGAAGLPEPAGLMAVDWHPGSVVTASAVSAGTTACNQRDRDITYSIMADQPSMLAGTAI